MCVLQIKAELRAEPLRISWGLGAYLILVSPALGLVALTTCAQVP